MLWLVALVLWFAANQAVSLSTYFPLALAVIGSMVCLVVSTRFKLLRGPSFIYFLSSSLVTWSFSLQQISKREFEYETGPSPISPFGFVRESFKQSLMAVSGDSGALVMGLAIGDDSSLSTQLSEQMKIVGLTHLTAVSGANCAIVVGLVYLILKRISIPRAARTTVALVALLGYVLLVGPQPSVLRAAFMAGVVLVAIAAGRKSAPLSALGIAIICLLIADPWLSTKYGFALSVAATAGILVLAPTLVLRLNKRLPSWLSLGLAVAFAAQIACWPLLLQLQGGISTYSLLANLAAEPLVAPVTVLGLVACAISPLLPGLTSVITWLASCLTWLIVQIAQYLSSLPGAVLSWPEGAVGTVLALLVLTAVVVWLRFESQRLRAIAAAACVLTLAAITGSSSADLVRSRTWMASSWDIVSCDVGQGDATVLKSNGQIAVIDVGREPKPIDECLSELGVDQIHLLILTHFDQDHIGGLSGALANRQVTKALITDFVDDRPAAEISAELLVDQKIEVIRVFRGVEGTLGDLHWRVLSPKMGAAEAEDSNDGSVTTLFSSTRYHFLALADLGEPGQMRIAPELGRLDSRDRPLILKVSHHGSADQYPELHEALAPNLALISAGQGNSYGHPTTRTLDLLRRVGSTILRTDLMGSISIAIAGSEQLEDQFDIRFSG